MFHQHYFLRGRCGKGRAVLFITIRAYRQFLQVNPRKKNAAETSARCVQP